MQNIVTWGQNMSTNIEEFVCISMGGLFSGVPPWAILYNLVLRGYYIPYLEIACFVCYLKITNTFFQK